MELMGPEKTPCPPISPNKKINQKEEEEEKAQGHLLGGKNERCLVCWDLSNSSLLVPGDIKTGQDISDQRP